MYSKILLSAKKNKVGIRDFLIKGYRRFNLIASIYLLRIMILGQDRKKTIDRGGLLECKEMNFIGFSMDNLGDMLRSTPAIRALKAKYPNSKLTMIVNNYNHPVLANNHFVDNFVVIPQQPTILSTLVLLNRLSKRKFTHAFIFSFGPLFAAYASLFFFILRVPNRLGWSNNSYNYLLTETMGFDNAKTHVQNMLNILKPLGVISDCFLKDMFLTIEEERAGRAILRKYDISGNRLVILVCPGGYGHLGYTVSRLWPLDKYRELCQFLINRYKASIIISGSKNELSLANDLQSSLGDRAINIAGKVSIRELAAILKETDFVVTNDNGTFHIADAVKAKNVLAILGPTAPEVITESGNKNINVVSKRLSCGPCITVNKGMECIYGEDQKCFSKLLVEDVIQILEPKIKIHIRDTEKYDLGRLQR